MYKITVLADIIERADPPVLNQRNITEQFSFSTVEEVAVFFEEKLMYLRPQSNKYETFSYVACHFGHTETEEVRFVDGRFQRVPLRGWLRRGEAAADELTLLGFDIDNPDFPDVHVSTGELLHLLGALGGGLYWHSFSHGIDRDKVRAVMFPNRPITWGEHYRIFAALDWCGFRGQGDGSIYDRGDHLYGPTHRWGCSRFSWGGGLVDVDALLNLAEQLPEEAWRRASRRRGESRPKRMLTEAELADLNERLARERNPVVSVKNPRFFNPAWREEYAARAVNGSHWETMRSLLARIWVRAGQEMGFGDLHAMAVEIDETDGNYFRLKYGDQRLVDLVSVAMRLPGGRPRSLRRFVDGRMHTAFLMSGDVDALRRALAGKLKTEPSEEEFAQLVQELCEEISMEN